jgi:hypothetical protein
LARKTKAENGSSILDEAMAALAHSQAMLIQNQAAFLGRISELEKVTAERFARIDERFARLEADFATVIRVLDEHGRILADHGRILERLPDAVREKIGFKS